MQEFLLNPTLRKEQKQSLVEDVMKKQNYSSITVNLFSALGENNRFNRIDGVVKTFNRIMSAHRGEILCTVISAKVVMLKFDDEINYALYMLYVPLGCGLNSQSLFSDCTALNYVYQCDTISS